MWKGFDPSNPFQVDELDEYPSNYVKPRTVSSRTSGWHIPPSYDSDYASGYSEVDSLKAKQLEKILKTGTDSMAVRLKAQDVKIAAMNLTIDNLNEKIKALETVLTEVQQRYDELTDAVAPLLKARP